MAHSSSCASLYRCGSNRPSRTATGSRYYHGEVCPRLFAENGGSDECPRSSSRPRYDRPFDSSWYEQVSKHHREGKRSRCNRRTIKILTPASSRLFLYCSGQVTGGVLRGDRARFQLFGDTVNTAARMESTGERGRIQLSQSTCDLLVSAGKERWVFPRKDTVAAKGKGILQTYWLQMDGGPRAANMADSSSAVLQENAVALVPNTPHTLNSATVAGKQESRLVGWMTEVLLDYVKQIVSDEPKEGGLTQLFLHIPTETHFAFLFSRYFFFRWPRTRSLEVELRAPLELPTATILELFAWMSWWSPSHFPKKTPKKFPWPWTNATVPLNCTLTWPSNSVSMSRKSLIDTMLKILSTTLLMHVM